MIFLGQQADSGSGGLSGLKLILQAGTAGFDDLYLPLQSSAECALREFRQRESWSQGWYCPISHGQSHDFRRTPRGYICSCFLALLLSILWPLKAAMHFVRFYVF